nr:MAG TPA: hypothetical protein [Caudoviricetes sp.]
MKSFYFKTTCLFVCPFNFRGSGGLISRQRKVDVTIFFRHPPSLKMFLLII